MGIGRWMVGALAGGAVVAAIASADFTVDPVSPSGGSARSAPTRGAPGATEAHRHEGELRPAVRRHPEAVRPQGRRRAAPRPRGVVRQLDRERALVASALLYLIGADVPPLQR